MIQINEDQFTMLLVSNQRLINQYTNELKDAKDAKDKGLYVLLGDWYENEIKELTKLQELVLSTYKTK